MFRDVPNVLQGPVTQSRPWWVEPLASGKADNPDDRQPPSDKPIRTDLVQRVRREIAAGTYETPEKWDVALDRLLDRLDQE